jgi:hypothetical protein
VWNLHHGRWRGLTWHDEKADVVWLLGVGWHESGSIDDVYAVLKGRDAGGHLLPDEDDYRSYETWRLREEAIPFLRAVATTRDELIDEARTFVGVEVRARVAARITVGFMVAYVNVDNAEIEERRLTIYYPPEDAGPPLPPEREWFAALLGAFFPDAHEEDLQFESIDGSAVTVSWCDFDG